MVALFVSFSFQTWGFIEMSWWKVVDCGSIDISKVRKGELALFMGEFKHSIDSKGRLIIPAKFRSQLGDHFVLTRGMDGCLFGYPQSSWTKMEKKLDQLPMNKKDSRAFVRFFYSAATECELDKQGRVNLPETLIDHAAINKKCVVVGVSDRFEIWSAERWAKFAEKAAANFDEIAEEMDFDF